MNDRRLVRPADESPTGPKRSLVMTLALACGVGVANIYFPQAITPLIAHGLRVRTGLAAAAVTAAQFGYAVGIFFLVPLGDRLVHRKLIPALLGITGLGLIGAGTAPDLAVLVVASAVVGAVTVVPQIIIPMAAGLVAADRRGAVTGTLLSGLIGGILLARTFSGVLGQWLGWRAPYLVAAALILILAAVMTAVLPATVPTSQERYPRLVTASLRLLREEPDLRRSCVYQATVFAGFSAAWTSLTLYVTGPAYHLGASAVGLIALVGAASMFCTPIAGRRTDRDGPDAINLVCILGALLASGILAFGSAGGAFGIVVLTVGMLVLDVSMQSGQVANQARIFVLRPEARGRLNTAYMTCAFLGGSAGSWLGVRAYDLLGWPGVCELLAVLPALALARHVVHLAARSRATPQDTPAESADKVAL
ncbi:Predicted arabinose efflux permease, MFS family [Actinacidiphila guanduensis]|uniref:Predicted arabinose efflux permease, MFS family n=2 Tax=Actinacidiphila guanduensis TaxID=310781 RepID=A0A1G9Z976_9ACTN|nr:Predicted arabinose efflux permease, MFS family [Actinacidiphila guanduensis]